MIQAGVTENEIKAMAARESGSGAAVYSTTGSRTVQPVPVPATPRSSADIFGGYSYLNADFGLGVRQSFNGWEASTSFTGPNPHFAAEFDVSGYYASGIFGSGLNLGDYGLLAGPRVNFGPAFVHGLFGANFLGAGAAVSNAQVSFATVIGGGVQTKAHNHLGVRVSVDYVMTRYFGATQNSVRITPGIVYTFRPSAGF